MADRLRLTFSAVRADVNLQRSLEDSYLVSQCAGSLDEAIGQIVAAAAQGEAKAGRPLVLRLQADDTTRNLRHTCSHTDNAQMPLIAGAIRVEPGVQLLTHLGSPRRPTLARYARGSMRCYRPR